MDRTLLEAGQSMQVTATVYNAGQRAATFDPTLAVDGRVTDTRTVPLEAGETETLAFEHQFEDVGFYAITVASTAVGNVTVINSTSTTGQNSASRGAPPEEDPVAVIEPRLATDWVQRGYNATVLTAVANPWNQTVSSELTVTVDGEPIATRTVEIVPNETRTVRVEFPATAGLVAVNGIPAGQLNVSQSLGADAPPQTQTTATGPGFGLRIAILVVGALVSAAALVRSRDDSD